MNYMSIIQNDLKQDIHVFLIYHKFLICVSCNFILFNIIFLNLRWTLLNNADYAFVANPNLHLKVFLKCMSSIQSPQRCSTLYTSPDIKDINKRNDRVMKVSASTSYCVIIANRFALVSSRIMRKALTLASFEKWKETRIDGEHTGVTEHIRVYLDVSLLGQQAHDQMDPVTIACNNF